MGIFETHKLMFSF
jgi:dynein heavy chain